MNFDKESKSENFFFFFFGGGGGERSGGVVSEFRQKNSNLFYKKRIQILTKNLI